jgi:hypothetical protein
MKFFKIIKSLAFFSLFALMLQSKSYATSSYGLSCTNDAYGTQHGGVYTDEAFVDGSNGVAMGYGIVHYAGRDCVYSGGGRTNSVAIVSGDVARNAANVIVGGINSRIAMAMTMNSDTAAHMTYSSNNSGIGMAANKVFGGLSIWTSYSRTNSENDQTFDANNRGRDSNAYDSDSSALSFGIDKMFGNILIGVTGTALDYDIDTEVNTGSYDADGNTYGIYLGLDTGVLRLSAGAGTGELDISTTRIDLGTENTTITGTTDGDIEYFHISASATFQRGPLTIMPRLGYRSLDLDSDAFTDVVPNDANTIATDTLTTADESIAAFSAKSEIMDIGVSVVRSLGALTPYLDVSYASEDSTNATYNTEIESDGFDDAAATDADGYWTVGAGINLNLRGKLSANLQYIEIMDRDDYEESIVSGTLKLSF